jgi:hypothetical protein
MDREKQTDTIAPDDDLDDLLGPKPLSARELQALVRQEKLGPGRVKGDKRSVERMLKILKSLANMPVVGDACTMAGIHRATLGLWLVKSRNGIVGDGFDIPIGEESSEAIRFHEAYDYAMEDGLDSVERGMMQRALGYLEPLTFQGRVIYKRDPRLVGLGLAPEEEYLLDADGKPVPESVMKQDPDLMMFIMKCRRKAVYGNKSEIDVNHRGGVLVVGAKAVTGSDLNKEELDFRTNAVDVEFEEVDE